jgi:peptide/nickel transport system substrate-binding protein
MMLSTVMPLEPIDEAAAATISLRIGMIEPIDSLNPFIGINDNAYIFYALIYDYLVAVDENGQPKPNLAGSWYVVPDQLPVGSVWQYNLTRTAYWHDGEPFTATDVKFTMDYQSGLNWSTMWAYQPYTLLINYTEIIDENTVRIHFKDFDGKPAACSFGASMMMPIIPEHIWKKINVQNASFSYDNRKPIGTGPFMATNNTYKEFLSGDRFILMKNPNYHLGAVKFDRLIIEFYLEPTAMEIDIKRGAIDLASLSTPSYATLADWLVENPTNDIGTYSGLICNSYSVAIDVCMKENSYNNLRRDPAVRKAMVYMTNKEFIRDHVYQGYARTGYSIMSPLYGDLYWEPGPDEVIPYDEDLANQVLDAAGYVWNGAHTVRVAGAGNTFNNPGTELSFTALVETELFEDRATAMYLKEQWAKVGIKMNIQLVDSANWNTNVYDGAYDLAFTYWSGDPDPNYLLFIQSSFALNGWSENWFSDPRYDYNYSMSILEVDPEKRKEYILNCEKIMYEECCYITTVYPYGCYAWRNDHFTGWGNWSEHPSREINNYWSANDLWFDLEPVVTNQPPMGALDNVAGHLNETVQITGWAYDIENDSMTYVVEFGDGGNASGSVSQNSRFSESHTYNATGDYLTTLTLFDGTGSTLIESQAKIVPVGWNAPPSNVHLIPSPCVDVETGSLISFTIGAMDSDGDQIKMNLTYGDGSAVFEHVLSGDTTTITQTIPTHTYDTAGNYDIVLVADDGHNATIVTYELTVSAKSGGFGSTILIIGAVAAVAAVAAAVLLMRRRKKGPEKEEGDVQLPM